MSRRSFVSALWELESQGALVGEEFLLILAKNNSVVSSVQRLDLLFRLSR